MSSFFTLNEYSQKISCLEIQFYENRPVIPSVVTFNYYIRLSFTFCAFYANVNNVDGPAQKMQVITTFTVVQLHISFR